MHGPGARDPALAAGLEDDPAAALCAACLPVVGRERGEAEHAGDQRLAGGRVGHLCAHGLEPLQRVRRGHLQVGGVSGASGDGAHGELVAHPLGIGEAQHPSRPLGGDALAAEALLPEVERLLGGDPMHDRGHHPRSGVSRLRARVLEEA